MFKKNKTDEDLIKNANNLKTNQIKADYIAFQLRQLGAVEVTEIKGFLYYIKFNLGDDLEVFYTYNINKKNKYFLQRMEPYPMPRGMFDTEADIVDFITADLKRIKNAKNSKNFELFLKIALKLNQSINNLEDAFLNYNIDKSELINIDENLENLRDYIQSLEGKSKKIDIKD